MGIHCTGGYSSVPGVSALVPGTMHWYRGLAHCTGVYKWGPLSPAPSHRCPPVSGGGDIGRGTPPRCRCRHRHRCRCIDAGVYTAQCMHADQCVQCIHCTVCTYSVQCTVYTLISVTIVYTDQCIARVYTDQCMRCLVCTVVQWQWIPTMSLCTVSMVYSLYSVNDTGRKKGKITLAY